jgi:hypothetical protein
MTGSNANAGQWTDTRIVSRRVTSRFSYFRLQGPRQFLDFRSLGLGP